MSQEIISDSVAPVEVKKTAKKKSQSAKVYPKKLDKLAKTTENEFEFSGRVGSINVKGTGVNTNQFHFSLLGKKGSQKSYLLDPAEPVRFSAMANLLMAASGSGAKVKIRSVLNQDGSSFASELEVKVKS